MISIRMKLSGFLDTFRKFLPFGEQKEDEKKPGTEQLEAIKESIEKARDILSNKEKTHFNLVLIPEAMSIYESERSLGILKEYNIPVETIIVNQLIPENRKCPFCTEKRKLQQERVKEIENKFKGQGIQKIPLHREEVRGFKMLDKVGKELYS